MYHLHELVATLLSVFEGVKPRKQHLTLTMLVMTIDALEHF